MGAIGFEPEQLTPGSVLIESAGVEAAVWADGHVVELHPGSHVGFVMQPLPFAIGKPQHDTFPCPECQPAMPIYGTTADEDAVVYRLVFASVGVKLEVTPCTDIGPVERLGCCIPNWTFPNQCGFVCHHLDVDVCQCDCLNCSGCCGCARVVSNDDTRVA